MMNTALEKLVGRSIALLSSGTLGREAVDVVSSMGYSLSQLNQSQNRVHNASVACSMCVQSLIQNFQQLSAKDAIDDESVFHLTYMIRFRHDSFTEEEAARLVLLLSGVMEPITMANWPVARLVNFLFSVAKSCPSAASAPVLQDVLVCINNKISHVNAKEIATLFWSLVVLQFANRSQSTWNLCYHRCVFLYPKMDEKSKGKVTHALLLLPNSAEENYDELLHLVVGSSDLYPSDSTTPYEKTKDDIGVKILSQAHHFSDKMLIVVFKHYVSRPESEELRMCCYQLSKKKFGVSQAADLVLFILHANLLEAALESGGPISTVWNASLQVLTADGSKSFSIDKVMALVSLCAVFLNESHIPFRLHFNSEWRDSVWRALQQSLTSPELSSLVSGGEASGRLLWCVFAARAVITAGNVEKDKTTFLDAVLHRSLTGPSSKKLPNSLSIVEDVCLCYPFVAEECVKVHSTLLEDVAQILAEHLDQQPLGAILHLCYDLENATLSCKNKFRTLTLHVLDCLEHRHHDSFFVADLGQFLKIKTQGTPTTTSSSPVLPDTLIDLYLRLLTANGGAIDPVAETVLIRYVEERSTERQKLESAFRKLLVRRLGQSACFLDSVTPQPDFLVTLIRLGEPLYRRHDPISVSVLRRLFELLSFAVEKECHHMTSVNEVASLLSMPFCQEIQIKGQLSEEIIKKATQLLSNEKGRLVKPLDRAFLVAYLVRADIPIPDQLQQALAH